MEGASAGTECPVVKRHPLQRGSFQNGDIATFFVRYRQERSGEPETRFLRVYGVAPEIAGDLHPRLIERLPHRLQHFGPIGGAFNQCTSFHVGFRSPTWAAPLKVW